MDYAYQKSTLLNEFRTPSLHAINHDKMVSCIIHRCGISLHEVVHHTHQAPAHCTDLIHAPSSYEGLEALHSKFGSFDAPCRLQLLKASRSPSSYYLPRQR